MAEKKKKYYWLKLQKDFFKRHDTRIIESMDNGKDYILFYLKLLVESIDHEGHLRFSESIPYNEKMLATITNTNVDIVRSAVKIFTELGLMQTLDDETIYMSDIETMLGCESEWAEKKRLYRENKKALEHKTEDNVRNVSYECTGQINTMSDKSIEKEIRVKSLDKEIDINKEKNTKKENYFLCESLSYFLEDDFQEPWKEWMDFRKKKKCLISERSMQLIYNKLINIDKDTAIKMIDKSIISGWTDLYEVSNKPNYNKPNYNENKWKGEQNFDF